MQDNFKTTTRHRLLLYAAVPESKMLRQGFYAAEVDGLTRQDCVAEVVVTNALSDVWRADYDGLVCYFYSYSGFAALLARLRGKPVVTTGGAEQLFRGMAPSLPVYLVRLSLFWLTLLASTRLLATSSTDYSRMLELGWFRRRAIGLSFHGAEAVDKLSPDLFSSLRAPGSMVTICGMDTLENIQRKGLLRAVDLVARYRHTVPGARLTIIGRTTRADIVRDYAAKLGCDAAIAIAGYVTEAEKQELLCKSRYYVQLSDYEGFGIGALEALALGCQVIHSNVGGLRDSVAGYGQIVAADDSSFVPDPAAPYAITDWSAFAAHMAQFSVARRARTILDALSLQ